MVNMCFSVCLSNHTNIKIYTYFCNKMDFASFILQHDGDDLGALALSRDKWAAEVEDFSLALSTLEVRRKLRGKVPEWVAVPSLRFPLRLSAEQCSSSETARYKASVAASASGGRIADLTGGLGVDSWAFSQRFGEVLYNEMRPELAEAARFNFQALGLENITLRSRELLPGNLLDILDGFQADILFVDPARRAADGRKVFRLEDCQPEVLQLLPELFQTAPRVLLKLSPMADISLVCKQLGSVKAVHVVAAEGECKELLLLLERGYAGPYVLTVYEGGAVMSVSGTEDISTGTGNDGLQEEVRLRWEDGEVPEQAQWLFEPGKALLKAGVFSLPCRYGLAKLSRHTHLYTAPLPVSALTPFGKWFRILEAVPFSNRSVKILGRRYPSAEVTARNLPLTSEELRAKLGCRSGGPVHIFGCTVGRDRYLLVAAK